MTDHPKTNLTSEASNEARRVAQEAAKAVREARKAAAIILDPQTKVYQDSAPGTGWVLQRKNHKRYYRTAQEATEAVVKEDFQTQAIKTAIVEQINGIYWWVTVDGCDARSKSRPEAIWKAMEAAWVQYRANALAEAA